MAIASFIILGGLKRIASFAEAVVPFMVIPFLAIKNSEKTENKYGAVPAGKSFAEATYSENSDKAADVIEFETITDEKSLKRSA